MNIQTFIGQVFSDVERKDNRLHFSLFSEQKREEINCISSQQFEVENQKDALALKPGDFIKVYGQRQLSGVVSFDRFDLPKKPTERQK